MLNIKYEFTKYDKSVRIHVYNAEGLESFSNINVSFEINKRLINQITSVVELSSLPLSMAHLIMKDFRTKIEEKLVESIIYISDKDLRDKMIDYAKYIGSTPDSVCTIEFIDKFASDIEENISFLME